MNTPDQNADIERRIAAEIEETDSPEIASVYLLGSFADGRAHRESDVDIGVVMSRDFLPTRRERFEASLRLGTMLGAARYIDRADLVVLNDAPPLLGRRIVTDGQRIFCRDSEIDHAFVRDVQLRAVDLQPFIDRMQKIKLETLAPKWPTSSNASRSFGSTSITSGNSARGFPIVQLSSPYPAFATHWSTTSSVWTSTGWSRP